MSDNRFKRLPGMTLTQAQLHMKGYPGVVYRFVGDLLASSQDVVPGRVNVHVDKHRRVIKVEVE